MEAIELIKVLILGIVEGITEWLPISSTGHMILVDKFMQLNVSPEFMEMFLVVIQLGAIMAVVVIYFKKLNPISKIDGKIGIAPDTMTLWYKIIVACIPAAIIGLAFDDMIDEMFYNYKTVAVMLIFYGIVFIVVERKNHGKSFKINSLNELSFKTAFMIGLFQVLALIPGTSRSGATIIGGMLVGTSRVIAAEFTFFLAIPVMFGASLLKLLKFGFDFSSSELVTLSVGLISAFVVSIIAIKFLVKYIQRNDFQAFGWYRIVLGIIVLAYFNLI